MKLCPDAGVYIINRIHLWVDDGDVMGGQCGVELPLALWLSIDDIEPGCIRCAVWSGSIFGVCIFLLFL